MRGVAELTRDLKGLAGLFAHLRRPAPRPAAGVRADRAAGAAGAARARAGLRGRRDRLCRRAAAPAHPAGRRLGQRGAAGGGAAGQRPDDRRRPPARPAHRGPRAASSRRWRGCRCRSRWSARRSGRPAGETRREPPRARTDILGRSAAPPPGPDEGVPVALRMSTLFLRTLREDPADAEVPSHRLLVRAGYIRRVAPGIYTWLPLGLTGAAQRRARSSARRWTPSAPRRCTSRRCCPASPTRRPAAGPSTATTSSGSRTARAPTTCSGPPTRRCSPSLVKDLYSSYKDLPLSLYQIQTKYRDEARPRAGHPARPRVRHEGLLLLRHRRRRARRRPTSGTATPTSGSSTGSGFDYVIVAAMSGAMGGSASRGVPRRPPRTARTPTSAAPTATTPPTSRPCGCRSPTPCRTTTLPAAHVEDTPDTPTIETLVDHLNERVPARRTGPGRPPTR